MGCWNETCFLTRLPVFAGDRVKLLFTVPVPGEYRNTVHCNGWFTPISLPVSGEYDDYGRIEDCLLEEPVLKVLSVLEFRIPDSREDGKYGPVALPGPGDKAGWQEALTSLAGEARQGTLEARIGQPGNASGTWLPVLPQIAHAWAWDYLSGACREDAAQYAGTMEFRLSVAGPLRAALRPLEKREWPAEAMFPGKPGEPAVPLASAQELAGLMLAMDSMRLAFGPTCGSGSQDGLSSDWQTGFYKKLFCHAARLPCMYAEYPQPPFSAAVAWDGNFLQADRNCGYGQAPDVPVTEDADALGAALLEAGVNNLLSAMSEAYESGDEDA